MKVCLRLSFSLAVACSFLSAQGAVQTVLAQEQQEPKMKGVPPVYDDIEPQKKVPGVGKYEPTDVVPAPDVYHFPEGSDTRTYEDSLKSMEKLKANNWEIGKEVSERFTPGFPVPDWHGHEYGKHPYLSKRNQKPGCNAQYQRLGGFRQFDASNEDWITDTMKLLGLEGGSEQDMLDCMEPSLVAVGCSACFPQFWFLDSECTQVADNTGWTFEYWWPSETIDLNNFEISALNPRLGGGNLAQATVHSMYNDVYAEFYPDELKEFFEKRGVENPDRMMTDNDLVNHHLHLKLNQHSAETQPGDQTLTLEAHVYQTEVNYQATHKSTRGRDKLEDFGWIEPYPEVCIGPIPILYNGYKKGAEDTCFYDTLDAPRQIVTGWTEEQEFMPVWRIAELSEGITPLGFEQIYRISTPSQSGELSPRRMIADPEYVPTRSCSSFRIAQWGDLYQDLDTAVQSTPGSPWKSPGIQPYMGPILDIGGHEIPEMALSCYFGGGQLYPVVQNLMGHYSPMPSTAYLARRAIELITNPKVNKRDYPMRPPRYADHFWIDKLQRVYPDKKATRCFRMNDVYERDEELFPKDLERIEHDGDVRYIYWNKRTACVCPYRGIIPAAEDKEPLPDTYSQLMFSPPNGMQGWGCLAGVDPGNAGHAKNGEYNFNLSGNYPPIQSDDDWVMGRGDFFLSFNLGLGYLGPGWPAYAEAAQILWDKEHWGAGQGVEFPPASPEEVKQVTQGCQE